MKGKVGKGQSGCTGEMILLPLQLRLMLTFRGLSILMQEMFINHSLLTVQHIALRTLNWRFTLSRRRRLDHRF